MKLLVGRRFEDPDVQKELSRAPFKAVKMPHGGVGICMMYSDEEMIVSVEHLMAMMLVKAKDISLNANAGLNLADAVLAVPHWYTNSQRRGILQSCEIASLNCLKVTNESNAIALSYGIFKSAKKLFSETEPCHIMFIDVGYSGCSVTVVDFIQENMKTLSTVCERGIGGRDFDDIIIEMMAEAFQKKTGTDVRGNKKAYLKLQAAAEKAKKTLSPAGVTEASVSVECLANETDLNMIVTRDEFERRAAPLVARLRAPIERALSEAGLQKEQLAEVEIVGGTTRINIVKKTLGEILGLDPSALNYGLKTTMNADEAVARGGALQCAMLSSRMKVKPFNIVDRVPYGIVAHFDLASEEGQQMNTMNDGEGEDTAAKGTSVSLYVRGDELPHKPRRITFRNKTSDFAITLTYDDAAVALLPAGENRFIGKYTVRVPPQYSSTPSDVRVTFVFDRHGLIALQSAHLMEEIPASEIPADAKEEEGKMSVEEQAKKKMRKVDLKVDVEEPCLSKEQVKAALELEASMAFEDRLIVETADKRNELESYIYSMRDKLDGLLKDYGTKDEKDKLKALMNSAEDWLYNEGYETTKQEYVRKIDELRKIGDPIEHRFNQVQARPPVIESLKKQLEMCKAFAANYDEAHSHITGLY